MAKTRQTNHSRKLQVVFSKPRKTFKEKYLTATGLLLLKAAKTKKEKAEVWKKHGKNRYTLDTSAEPIRNIHHPYRNTNPNV